MRHRNWSISGRNINNHGDYDISNDTVALMVEDIELTDHGIQFIVDQDAFASRRLY